MTIHVDIVSISGPPGPAGPPGSGGLFVKRTLTSAELLALFTTPIELVPAVVGVAVVPYAVFAYYRPGNVGYDGGNILIGSIGATAASIQGSAFSGLSPIGIYAAMTGGDWDASVVGGGLLARQQSYGSSEGNGEVDLTVWYNLVTV